MPARKRTNVKRYKLLHSVIGKKEFLAQHGRVAWARLPKTAIFRSGKRMFVTHEAIVDRAWEPRSHTDLSPDAHIEALVAWAWSKGLRRTTLQNRNPSDGV